MNFAWILVLSPWLGLLILILDDVTKDDSGGGAIRIAATRIGAFVYRNTLKARKLWKVPNQSISQSRASNPPAGIETAAGNSWLSSKLVSPLPLIGRTAKKKSGQNGGRNLTTIPDLELAITEAVKKASPQCETFVGVVLEKTKPRSRRDVNWELRGAKFGQADRRIASEAPISTIDRMQREFYILDR